MAFTFDSNGLAITISSAGGLNAAGSNTKTLTMGASVWTVSGNFNISGSSLTFNSNTSEVKFNLASTITTNGKAFNKLTLLDSASPVTYTLGDNVTANGTLNIDNSVNATDITINGNTLFVKGDVTTGATNRNVKGTSNFNITGTGNQNITMTFFSTNSLSLPFTINSTGGTVTIAGTTFNVSGNWTYTAGTVSATGTVIFQDTLSVTSGTMAFNNVKFVNTVGSKTLTIVDTMTINGNLTTDLGTTSGANYTINGATINLKGNLSSGATERTTTGTATLAIVATSGTQTIVWTAFSTNYFGLNLTFNSSSTIQFGATFKYGSGTMTYTAGTMDFSTNTNLMTINQNCNLNLGTAAIYQLTVSNSSTATLTGDMSLSNTLTINSGASFAPVANTLNLSGNFTNNGTFTRGTSTVLING